jgi:hypothetical protein
MYIVRFPINEVEKLVLEANRVLIAFPVLHIDFSDSQKLILRDEAFSDDLNSFISSRRLRVVNFARGADCRFSFVALYKGKYFVLLKLSEDVREKFLGNCT